MNKNHPNTWLAITLACVLALLPPRVGADDIDIFLGLSGSGATNPNVLIVLDNTSNWARQSQQWPGGLQQGQSEARAISTVLDSIGSDYNLGLMEFVTRGNANDDGGFIRYPALAMTDANKAALKSQLTAIFDNITSPNEKRNSNTPYGNLMYDVYNYYAGANVSTNGANQSGTLNPPNPAVNAGGYTSNYSRFKSPLSATETCARNYLIFIGNPNSSGPKSDVAANTSALAALGGDTSELSLPKFEEIGVPITATLGSTAGCYGSLAMARLAYGWGLNANDGICQLYSAAGTLATDSVVAWDGTSATSADMAKHPFPLTASIAHTTSCPQYSGTGASTPASTDPAYEYKTQCDAYTQGCSLQLAPSNGGGEATIQTKVCTTGYLSAAPSITNSTTFSPGASTGVTCNDGTVLTCPSDASSNCTYTLSSTYDAVANPLGEWGVPASLPSGTTAVQIALASSCHSKNSPPFPNPTTSTTSPVPLQTPTSCTSSTKCTYSYWNWSRIRDSDKIVTVPAGSTLTGTLSCPQNQDCAYTSTYNDDYGDASGNQCTGSNELPVITQTATPKKTYKLTQTATIGGNGCLSPGTAHYVVAGTNLELRDTPTGSYTPDTKQLNADQWSRFLYEQGIPTGSGDSATRRQVVTYTIDVYNKQQNALHTSLLMSMAQWGRGKYYAAKNENDIVVALKKILAEINATNTTFASASLPISATNRAQNENQVFIGMFRPNQNGNPLWVGNMKRYQVVRSGDGGVELGGADGASALSASTGFLWNCALSYWTSDSEDYWSDVLTPGTPSLKTTCPTSPYGDYSDSPDGPMVEKGAAAEVIRKGNNPPATDTSPTWLVNRTVYTLNPDRTALTGFDAESTGLSTDAVNWVLGHDNNTALSLTSPGPEKMSNTADNTRPTLHGDVIHSRPLPVNYGGATGIYIFYGANDGTLRALKADTGKEQWAFIAPEASQAGAGRNALSSAVDSLTRLKDNSPILYFPDPGWPAEALPKDYFFDGSLGLYQNKDNTKVWIYPSMRRGGRMLYAFDVTDPTAPTLKWRVGCPNLTNDSLCSSGLSGIGQTWSTPNVGFVKGHSTSDPIVVAGGGYDTCEDADGAIGSGCDSAKGRAVYALDSGSGAVIRSFAASRSVAADVAYADVDYDGYPDYAYAVDTGGNLYRINFVDPATGALLDSDHWSMQRIAHTNGGNRKFLFAPAPLPNNGKVYLAIASGDREHPLSSQYPYTAPVTNRFYVFLDDPAAGAASVNLDDTDAMSDFTSGSTCSTPSFVNAGKKGWFMNLNQHGQGEQGVTSALLFGGMAAFSTNQPVPPGEGVCSTSLGNARGYLVNLLNGSGAVGVAGTCGGTQSNLFLGGGMPPSPVMATTSVTNTDGSRSVETIAIGIIPKTGGMPSPLKPERITPDVDRSRRIVYWKSLGND